MSLIIMAASMTSGLEFSNYILVDGRQFTLEPSDGYAHLKDDAGDVMPGGTSSLMPVCQNDPRCISFVEQYMELHAMQDNDTIITYVSNTTCGSTHGGGPINIVHGSCGHTETKWFACKGTAFTKDRLNTYQLPPSVCATTCDNDDKCALFEVTKDKQWCMTYKWHDDYTYPEATGYLKASSLLK